MAGYRLAQFRGWQHEERMAFCKLIDAAIAKGELKPFREVGCNRCGQKQGLGTYHSPWYASIKYAEPLCWRCHLVTHLERRDPQGCERYWEEIKNGKQYPPVFKSDISILQREHGICRRWIAKP